MKKNQYQIFFKFCSLLFIIILLANCKPADNSKKLLAQALKNKDYATAAFAYNNLLLADTNNLEFKDSLARLYIRSGNFEGGLRLAEQVMAKFPQNNKLLELMGVANEQAKNIDKAVANFNALFKTSQNYIYAGMLLMIVGILVNTYILVQGTLLESHLMEWLNIVIRLLHITFGIAWIGASFYFVFLENPPP